MATLDDLVRDLLDRWVGDEQHPGDGGPGLIERLDNPELRTSQARDSVGHAPPGSRPPTPIEALSWSRRIKDEAVQLDAELRQSEHRQPWHKALRAIPPGTETADRDAARRAGRSLSRWHGTVLTVLGLRGPNVHFKHVLCFVCGQRTVWGRADDDMPRAWCVNDACEDEDGEPARYDTARLYRLTENLSDPKDDMADERQGEQAELLRRALQQAEAHESGLSGLYWKLREAGHAYAWESAHAAAEAAGSLVQQLREDLNAAS